MKRSDITKLSGAVLLFSLSFAAAISSSPVTLKAKTVARVNWGHEPIEILDLRLYNKPIAFGQPFDSVDEAWMLGLRFQVKNTSNKSITYLRFELQFPLKDSQRQTYYVEPIEYGNDKTSTSRALKPGETIQLACQSINFDVLKRVVMERGEGEYLKLNRALISTEIVTFEDKTSWTTGYMLRFDDVSKKWVEIAKTGHIQVGAVEFSKASFIPKPQGECLYKAVIEDFDCTQACDYGGTRHVAVSGQSGTQKEVDKIYTCHTGCLIAYTGVAPCS